MRILITAGPTREYLDDVRYLTNASSGKMGYALATAAIAAGHEVDLVSGPVSLSAPAGCRRHSVETTGQMLAACQQLFPLCDGVIAAAAVCDYTPRHRTDGKLSKTGTGLLLDLVETADILATLGAEKGPRWSVGFALEAQDPLRHARQKLTAKRCDAIILNAPTAIGSDENQVELIDDSGSIIARFNGTKSSIATELIRWITNRFSAVVSGPRTAAVDGG